MNQYYKNYLDIRYKIEKQEGGGVKHKKCEKNQIKISEYLEMLDQNKLDYKLASRISDFFKNTVKTGYDPENMHILEDSLMKCFIRMMATGKLTNGENIANIIMDINDANYLKWYN